MRYNNIMEIGNFYVKVTDTNELKEVNFTDEKYVNVTKVTKWAVIKRSLTNIWNVFFKRNNISSDQLYSSIEGTARTIFDDHNQYLLDNDIPTCNYSEIFEDNNDQNVMNYFG